LAIVVKECNAAIKLDVLNQLIIVIAIMDFLLTGLTKTHVIVTDLI
jgi:hypothetical protein